MFNVWERIILSLVATAIACASTRKMLGAMQQSGYKNRVFWRWLKRKDNLQFNRLCVLALCLALASAITSLCFSFVGEKGAVACAFAIYFLLFIAYLYSDKTYALKVELKPSGRANRLFFVYLFWTACVSYILVASLDALLVLNGSKLYALIAFVPFAVLPILLPFLLCFAGLTIGWLENARNKKFVKRAGQVLDETEILRIGVVGSYGKTSVKNILKTLLEEKYTVVATPESYNTPIGIAKTVFSPEFDKKSVFIAEMGARKQGDISELCALVKPDYALFTGVCKQHVETFGSEENVWKEKSEILRSPVKKAVCGAGLKGYVEGENFDTSKVVVLNENVVESAEFSATHTRFALKLDGKEIQGETALLGVSAVENIALASALALALGLSVEEIERGIQKLQPIPHRLQLLQANGVFILDDGYNANPKGAKEAISALQRFSGRKCIVTPGIVECGVLEEEINAELGENIANASIDKVILVGETLVTAVKDGYLKAGGDKSALETVKTLGLAQESLKWWLKDGDAVLFLNDLPDVY